jgi:hypothetical protein
VGASLSWGNSFAKAWGLSFGRGDTPEEGGGGGGSASTQRKRSKGWVQERAIFEASQLRRQAQNAQKDQEIEVFEAVVVPTMPQVSYDTELEKLVELKKQLANLQIVYNSQQEQSQDRVEAALELSAFIDDEEDAIAAIVALQEYEARLLLTVLGVKV